MKNNRGFTLIELLAVIVVLAIVTVLATRSVLPFMSDARLDSFKIEATNVIDATENAISYYNLGQTKLKNNAVSCRKGNVVCFTVAELIDLGFYDGSKDKFSGKVLIDITSQQNPVYTLYLKKGSEFSINGSNETDYVNNGDGAVSNGGWTSGTGQTECDCS